MQAAELSMFLFLTNLLLPQDSQVLFPSGSFSSVLPPLTLGPRVLTFSLQQSWVSVPCN